MKTWFLILSLITTSYLGALPEQEDVQQVNFVNVPIVELIRFVSKISKVNFLFNHEELQFNVSLSSGKPVPPAKILKAVVQMLKTRGFDIREEDNTFVVHLKGEDDFPMEAEEREVAVVAAPIVEVPKPVQDPYEFFTYKLQYHEGSEILESLKQIGSEMRSQSTTPQKLLNAIQSAQWVKATNSLLCSGDAEVLGSLKKLIASLDIPLRQVFIEVLVIETDVRKSSDFGLQWGASGHILNKLKVGGGNFPPGHPGPFAHALQAPATPIPLGSGFDMGVIGDLILHKGKTFLSLGSLVSALQIEGDSTIVLNQKIITQDNKNSKIFVGDNIPFTGSVVQTVGASQQTTSNIEYRDIGVNLSIKPRLGEGDVITLDIEEEITETVNDTHNNMLNSTVNGIRTTKTNMLTHVHVPDKHFLVLSGTTRNAKANQKSGLPCLGGLPGVGALFSNNKKQDEKRSVIVFVRPHIIHSMEDYRNVTANQDIDPTKY